MVRIPSGRSAWLLACVVFAVCIAPTFISYQPYLFRWDEADYLTRAIVVSRSFWHGDTHRLLAGMVSIRPPAMTVLGIPWGPLLSWDAAGKCFLALAAATAFSVALCLFLLLRIGIKPVLLAAASLCIFAALGPYPAGATAHWWSTGFMADGFFAWISLAAVLLIIYEARLPSQTTSYAFLRGVFWGIVLSLGTMTKLSFLYFVVLVLPALLIVKRKHEPSRNALFALLGFAVASAPAAWYLVAFGQPAFQNARDSSFGGVSELFYLPLLQFLGTTVRESPGMVLSAVLVLAAVVYMIVKKQRPSWPELASLLIMIVYCVIVLSAPNRQIRYAFPVLIAIPFLFALVSGKAPSVSSRSALLVCIAVVCGMIIAALPIRGRASRDSLSRSEAVFAFAEQHRTSNIVIATDSPTLNGPLIALTRSITPRPLPRVDTLAYSIMYGVPLQDDLRTIAGSDVIIFQDKQSLFPPYTNERVPEYERFVRQISNPPVRLGTDLTAYFIQHPQGTAQQ
jgi:hypothetical protein